MRSRAPLRHRCDPASAAASAPLKPGGADKLLLSKRFYSAPAFDRGANNAETPQQPPRKVLCDAENGCQRRAPAGRPMNGVSCTSKPNPWPTP